MMTLVCVGSLLALTMFPGGPVCAGWAEGPESAQFQQGVQVSSETASEPAGSSSQASEEPAKESSSAEKKENEKSNAGEKPDEKSPVASKKGTAKEGSSKSSATKKKDAAKSAAKKTKKEKADQSKIEKSEVARSAASRSAGEVSARESKLASAKAELVAANDKIISLKKKVKKLKAQLKKVEERQAKAQSVCDAVNDEMSAGPRADLISVFAGEASFEDIDSRDYLLSIVASDQSKVVEKLTIKRAALEKKIDVSQKKIAKGAKTMGIKEGNEAAASLEKCLSKVREGDAKATSSLKGASSSKAVKSARAAAKASAGAHRSTLQTAYEKLGEWYELIDSLSGVDVAISYGVGNDFALSEEEFVRKWGTAIDKFYKQFGTESGFVPPLCGQGETMARIAYKYKVDPRLCAATSIIESSGGKYCIKSCNAWGWGAADSDPYGGASSWGSWEEAIQAWYEGMTASKTGLATARCVDELAATYCSSASWSAHVVEQMLKISALA